MTRRAFVIKTALAGSAIIVAGLLKWKYFGVRKLPLAYPLVLSNFCNEETIRNIGIKYLSLRPDQNSKTGLIARLLNGIGKKEMGSSEYSEIAGEVEMKAEEEFRTSQTLIIKGWVVSETEAQQCALLALS